MNVAVCVQEAARPDKFSVAMVTNEPLVLTCMCTVAGVTKVLVWATLMAMPFVGVLAVELLDAQYSQRKCDAGSDSGKRNPTRAGTGPIC